VRTPVAFQVLGEPSPQAGMRPVPIRDKAGNVRGTRQVTTGGVNLASWRSEVSAASKAAAEAQGGMLDGPLKLTVIFRFQMPTSRPRWAKEQGFLIRVASPDLDKLVRAAGDAMKVGGLIRDDALFGITHSAKLEVWESWTGAAFKITSLDQRAFMGEL
jgi:Holliday junction resolvase RusA-like endonuclease